MEHPKQRFVLFDFDGVIADSYAVAFETARTACAHITEEAYRHAFENNVYRMRERLMPSSHGAECQHDLDWFATYTPLFEERARPFPGMAEVIASLSHRYILIIISSTVTSPIQGFLEKHHIGRYFSEVMGADVHTSKVEKTRMVFERYQTTAGKCVFITDTLGDMREASECGVGSIGCSWGFQSHATLQRGEPFRIVDVPAELPAAIEYYFVRAF